MEDYFKLSSFDNIELLKVTGQTDSFPEHFHETFCISLIEEGFENIKMGDSVITSESGVITINNPYEIHSNPLFEYNGTISFTTLYLSKEIVEFFLSKKEIVFNHQQPVNVKNLEVFNELTRHIINGEKQSIQIYLNTFLKNLEISDSINCERFQYSSYKWNELIELIENKLDEKVKLTDLANFMGMDKFNFAKEFRKRHGLSPINFVLMQKIFRAKKLIDEGHSFTQIAHELYFTDSAHFSKQFKRFVGLSPRCYKTRRT